MKHAIDPAQDISAVVYNSVIHAVFKSCCASLAKACLALNAKMRISMQQLIEAGISVVCLSKHFDRQYTHTSGSQLDVDHAAKAEELFCNECNSAVIADVDDDSLSPP